jgi:hypothetical protein
MIVGKLNQSGETETVGPPDSNPAGLSIAIASKCSMLTASRGDGRDTIRSGDRGLGPSRNDDRDHAPERCQMYFGLPR